MENTMEKLVSLCKRRGFIYPGSEVYGGLAGTYDYGPLGVALKRNVTNLWWNMFVDGREDMYGIDASILMNPRTWEATGHVAGFSDPLVDDTKTKKRYRADHLLEEAGVDVKGMKLADMDAKIKELGLKSPEGNPLGDVRQFNMMFSTRAGAAEDSSSIVYLRPETAQGMFVNFKNVLDSFHPKLPFGMGQIGKAFRNEITPRDFTFRLRELEQMEIEYFLKEENWEEIFEKWRTDIHTWTRLIGLPSEMVHELDVAKEDLAHYSKKTIDFEFDFPFGRKELYGLAYRTNFDLKNHSEYSKNELSYFDEETKERFIPHCIEPSFGVERTILAILTSAYKEDTSNPEEVRAYLAFTPRVAPVKVAVLPLLKNKEALTGRAREIHAALRKEIGAVMYDDAGSIGKRYRKQDEIGTPWCVTVDFDTVEKDGTVTLRHRDTGTQERLSVEDLLKHIKAELA